MVLDSDVMSMFGICEIDLISGKWAMIGCTKNESIAKSLVVPLDGKFRIYYQIEFLE